MDYTKNDQSPYQPQTTNGKAIASMVVGIVSLVIPYIGIITGIIGIVLSRKASFEIRAYGQGGQGFAITGLVTSIVAVSLYGLILFFVIIVGALVSSGW